MKTYVVKAGDTLDIISARAYGVSSEGSLITAANPQLTGGLTPGMVLTIPPNPLRSDTPGRVTATRENEVSVLLNGKLFRFWETMTLARSIDSFDLFTLGSTFDPDSAEQRAAFAPLSFQRAEVFVGGDRLYTGTNISNSSDGDESSGFTVATQGYALAGVLSDCPTSAGSPLEFASMNLRDIATAQAKPFGLTPVFEADPGAAFDRVAIASEAKILGFWTTLAQQRKLVIGNNSAGHPVFRRETSEAATQRLELGRSPVRRVTPDFKPQKYYSHVTATTPSFVGLEGAKHTIANPFLQGVVRPFTFDAGDIEPGEEIAAAEAKIGRMFANAIAVRVDVVGWRNVHGELWAPNTKVRLLAPAVQIYRETEFLVRSVFLTRTSHEDTASLLCVLPGGFAGQIPEALPWLE